MSKQSAVSKALCKAVRAAAKKLPFKSERSMEEMMEGFGFSLADAYRCGAEEAQDEIVRRLSVLSDAAWQKSDPAPLPTTQQHREQQS
jgi:hypothetical protein